MYRFPIAVGCRFFMAPVAGCLSFHFNCFGYSFYSHQGMLVWHYSECTLFQFIFDTTFLQELQYC